MKKKLIVLSGFVFLGLAPVMALANANVVPRVCDPATIGGDSTGTIQGLLCKFGELLNSVIPIIIALGVLYFVWGVVSYVIASDEEAKKTGRDRIIFGIIGLAVILSVWGLVKIVTNTFGTAGTRTIVIPTSPY